ncbi:MAG: RNA methyltransferase [Clostridia bacterium]|nr:RNA methyltransferase [Clostridia bacterium]
MTEITSRDNAAVRRMIALQTKKKERRAQGLFPCEGEKVFREAVAAGVSIPECMLTLASLSRLQDAVSAVESRGGRAYIVPEHILAAVSDVESPQGVIFTSPIRRAEGNAKPRDLLICEEIRDPGNLGTIVRTADAFGCGGIYLCGDCADVWSPKVVRSCMGSIFRVPIYTGSAAECAAFCRAAELSLYVTKPRRDARALSEGFMPRMAVAIGNEAHGISDKLEALSDGCIYVDMTGGAESLNAAICAGVILWHMQSERGKN